MRKAKWLELFKDRDVERWYENLQRGSKTTARERMRVFYRYVKARDTTPKKLLQQARNNKKEVEDQLHDFVTEMEKKGYAPGYIENYIKAVRSWLDFNSVRLYRKIKLSNSNATPSIEDEQIPTKEELRTIIGAATDRARVSISFMAFTGVRPQVLGDVDGLDGLIIKDIPDLEIKNGIVIIKQIPMQINVRAKLSKNGKKYITFLCAEGVEYLTAYLERRIANGEELDKDSPIIATAIGFEKMGKSKKNYGSKFIETQNITREIRKAIRPRFKMRPYVMRSYFDTQLLLAESNGKIMHAYSQFFMGHTGDIEAKYTTNKGRLPPNLIEDMRRAYKDSEPFFITEKTSQSKDEIIQMLLRQWRDQAKLHGINPIELLKYKSKGIKNVNAETEIKFLQEEIIKRSAPHLSPSGTTYKNNKGREHKVINEKQLVKHLNDGWELIKEMNHNKYLLRKA